MPDISTKAVIEGMLFANEKPLYIEQIKKALDHLSTEDIRGFIGELANEYEQSGRGMRVVEIAGGFMMVTPADVAPFLKKLFKERRVERLSKPALETLAIIAYKQPLTKLEIESLRNVNIDGVMGSLLDKELIRVVGVKKAPGRPKVYGTTRQFLEYFGLKSLEELPKLEDLQPKLEEPKVEEDKNVITEPAQQS